MVINISAVPKMVPFITGPSDQTAYSGVVMYTGGHSNSMIVIFLLGGCQGLLLVFSLEKETVLLVSL